MKYEKPLGSSQMFDAKRFLQLILSNKSIILQKAGHLFIIIRY